MVADKLKDLGIRITKSSRLIVEVACQEWGHEFCIFSYAKGESLTAFRGAHTVLLSRHRCMDLRVQRFSLCFGTHENNKIDAQYFISQFEFSAASANFPTWLNSSRYSSSFT